MPRFYLWIGIALACLMASCAPRTDTLTIHFLEVKGGSDAILIQAGGENVLVDTGGFLNGHRLEDYLKAHHAERIKYLILTHAHPDHIGGAFFIIPKLRIEEIYDNGQALNAKDIVTGPWYKQLVRKRKNYRPLKQGDIIRLGDDVRLDVLWPKESGLEESNNASLVLKLNYGKFSCLFMGDLRHPGEKELLSAGYDLKSDILKVGHSGWKDATTQEFLDAVDPKAAIICIGEWGGPSKEILARLKEKNITTYRTDKGDIVVTVRQDGSYNVRQ